MKNIWVWLAAAVALWLLFRKPLEQMYQAKLTGLQAVADAATQNGYTTYNTAMYRTSKFFPLLRFIRGDGYVPGGDSSQTQVVDYSVQG